MKEDVLECLAGDIREAEKRVNQELKELHKETEEARKEVMDKASVNLEKIMTAAYKKESELMQRLSQETRDLRKKAFREYQTEMANEFKAQLEVNEQKMEVLARAQALEVYSVMEELKKGGTQAVTGDSYGPDVTGTRYGKGAVPRSQPYREPGRPAASGAVLRENVTTRRAPDRAAVTCLIEGEFQDRTEEVFIQGGVVYRQGSWHRADITTQLSIHPWFKGSPIGREGHRYYDGADATEISGQKQMGMDQLIENQLNDPVDKREHLKAIFRMPIEDYYAAERDQLRNEIVNPAILDPYGPYPWFMWRPAHFNKVFQKETRIIKKNRGINNELGVIDIPHDYDGGLTLGDESMKGASCYTVYLKGIPWEFHEGTLIKKLLEYGPMAGFYVEREPDTDRCTGIGYIKFKYPCSAEALIMDWTDLPIKGAGRPGMEKGWHVYKHRIIYAQPSRVELVIPGYPNDFKNQLSTDPEVRRWAIHLAFNVTPRYTGEFTKQLLQAEWLWGGARAPAQVEAPVERLPSQPRAVVTTAQVDNTVVLPDRPASPASLTHSVKDDDDDMASNAS